MKCPNCNILIDEHPASRCLDALVAEKVMGWHDCEGYWEDDKVIHTGAGGWYPSTSISAAWEVVEKLGRAFSIDCISFVGMNECTAIFAAVGTSWNDGAIGTAPTAPLAICRAALKAVNHDT